LDWQIALSLTEEFLFCGGRQNLRRDTELAAQRRHLMVVAGELLLHAAVTLLLEGVPRLTGYGRKLL
jgi:hypothetical protein